MSDSSSPAEARSKERVDQGNHATENHFPAANIPLHDSSVRIFRDRVFRGLCIATAAVSVAVLIWLLASILTQGYPSLTKTLIFNSPEPEPTQAGLRPALFGTIWVCVLCGLLTLPIGIGTAILLEEFRPKNKFLSSFYGIIQLNISNLAGVPSVVYGILGLTAFVSMFGLFDGANQDDAPGFEIGIDYYDQFSSEGGRSIMIPVPDPSVPVTKAVDGMTAYVFAKDENGQSIIDYAQMVPAKINVIRLDDPIPEDDSLTLIGGGISEAGRVEDKAWYYFSFPFGRGVLAGAMTLMLVILPVIIISSQEALRAVPNSLRDGARGLGATPWQVVRTVTLPAAIPGIMTGSILAMSRAIGETAPILIIAGIVYIRHAPRHLLDDFTVMPLQIYNWTSRPQAEFHHIAAGGIIILLVILLAFNGVAVFIRQKVQKPLS